MEFLFLLGVIVVLAPFILMGLMVATRSRLRAAEERLNNLDGEVSDLRSQILQLRRVVQPPPGAPRAAPAPAAAPARPAPLEAAAAPATPAPKPEAVLPPAAEIHIPRPVPGAKTAIEPEPTPPAPKPAAPAAPTVVIPVAATAAVTRPAARGPVQAEEIEAPSGGGFDWESLVGVKLFSGIAAVALLIGLIFFLRIAVEQGWLQPPVRMTIGIVVGVGLLVFCERRAAGRYRVTANALDASAVTILYSTFFAAHALWGLVGGVATFALLALVTVLAVVLAIRRESMFIAALGLLGGFAAPALLSTGQDNPLGLFGYLVLLNIGLAWVTRRMGWARLLVAALALTTLYQWGWVFTFLTPEKVPVAVGIFLTFPILAYLLLAVGGMARPESESDDEATARPFRLLAAVCAVLPYLAVFYLVLPPLSDRFLWLFGLLFLLDAGLLAVAIGLKHEDLHALGGMCTVTITMLWLNLFYAPAAWPVILLLVCVFVALYLLAPFAAAWLGRPFEGTARYAAFAAPLMLVSFSVLVGVEPAAAAPGLLFAVLFMLLAGIAAAAMIAGQGALYFVGAFFAVVAEAVWSGRHLSPDTLLPALGIYGVFGALYLAVPVVARRIGRPLQPAVGAVLLLFASLALLFFLGSTSMAPAALWGLALLLALLVMSVFVEAVAAGYGVLALVGVGLTWLVMMVWWAHAPISIQLVPALGVVAALTVLTLVGLVWVREKAVADNGVPEEGLYVGLAGHAFLVAVAGSESLALPPWPIFGVLAALLLAVAAAALYVRRARMQTASLALAVLILLQWEGVAWGGAWPTTAVVAAIVLALFSAAWIRAARRRAVTGPRVWESIVVALVGAQAVTIGATLIPGAPALWLLASASVALSCALLLISWVTTWRWLAPAALAPAFLAPAAWVLSSHTGNNWGGALLYGGLIYAAFIGFPVVLGRRAGSALPPYLAAAIANLPFFFIAYWALERGGFDPYVGALPVAQAVVMALLLVQLLRMQAPAERALGRLALVAATALAAVTVAIPLQLDNEWLTIAWALEGAALAWLFTRIPHRGLLWWSAALMAAVFGRLALNPNIFYYAPRGELRILNWYLYTYLVCSVAFLAVGRLLWQAEDKLHESVPVRVSRLGPAAAVILLFLLLNIEIADFYSVGPSIMFKFGATLAQDLTYTLGWGVFGVTLLAVGIVARSHVARVAALALLAVTVLKCFLFDLGRLSGLYRVGSFVGLAVCLALVAIILQKYVLVRPGGKS